MDSGPAVEEVIERVELFRGRAITTTLLGGGHLNRAYLVQADTQRYVVRIPAPLRTGLSVDRANELQNMRAAASAGVAPRVVAYLDDWHVIVAEFVNGRTLTADTLRMDAQLPRIVDVLRRLHGLTPFASTFDMHQTVHRWLRSCDQLRITPPTGIVERMDRVDAVARTLAMSASATVPCHNDLIAENILDDGQRLWLIDFEYSGNNDPCYELAEVANESDLDEDWIARLCEAYFGRTDPALLARMALHTVIANVGWAIWATIQHRVSTLSIDYADIAEAYRVPAVRALDSEDVDRSIALVARASG